MKKGAFHTQKPPDGDARVRDVDKEIEIGD